MESHRVPISLPQDYNENAIFLMVQGPRVLYAYWELSPGLKELLNAKKNVQIRLNIEGRGPCFACDLDLSQRSFYFFDLEPGLSYNCEIGIINSGNQFFYPLLRSNTANTPHDRPPGRSGAAKEQLDLSSSALISSFQAFYSGKK